MKSVFKLFYVFLIYVDFYLTYKIKIIENDFRIEELKKSVVMIDIQSEFQFYGEKSTSALATGFVVDEELGLIATNKHVTRISPTRHKIKFYDGSVVRGTVIYYDFNHDFGFIKLDDKNKVNLKAVRLGSSYDLNLGEELMLIGNNEGVNYSIKYGSVLQLNVPDFNGLGSVIQTSFDRTGGSSGSPVWNKKGEVVSIHAMGDNSYSFEVPIDHLKYALGKIKKNKLDKSFTGLLVNLIPLYKLEHGLNINNITDSLHEIIAESKNLQRVPNSTTPELIQINSITPDSPADGKLNSGDIIFKINNRSLGNDLILYEKLLDENVNDYVSFTIYRFGKLIQIENIKLISTEPQKIKKFIKLADTLIHPVNAYMRTQSPIIENGLFISEIGVSSPFNEISSDGGNILIASVSGNSVKTIENLINVLDHLCDRQNVYIEAMNLNSSFPRFLSYPIDLGDLKEVSIFEFGDGWTSKQKKLKDCLNKNKRADGDDDREKKFYFSNKKMEEIRKSLLKKN